MGMCIHEYRHVRSKTFKCHDFDNIDKIVPEFIEKLYNDNGYLNPQTENVAISPDRDEGYLVMVVYSYVTREIIDT